MPELAYLDLARHSTLSSGTGEVLLIQADGYPPPRLAIGQSYSYSIIDPVQRLYEVGVAPATAANRLDRAAGTVRLSSADGAHVDLPMGPKTILFGPLAETIENIDAALVLAQSASNTANSATLAATAAANTAAGAQSTAEGANAVAVQAQATALNALTEAANATQSANLALFTAQAAASDVSQALGTAASAQATANTAQTAAQDALTQLVTKANLNEVVTSFGGATGPIALQPSGGISAYVANGQFVLDGSGVTGAVSSVNGQTGAVSLPLPTLPLPITDVAGLPEALAAAQHDLTLSPLHTASLLGNVAELSLIDLHDATTDLVYTFPATLVPNDRFAVCVVREHPMLGAALLLDANGHAPLVPSDLSQYLFRTGDCLVFRALPHPTLGTALILERERLGTKPPQVVYVDSSDPGFTAAIPLTLQTGGGGYGNTVHFSNVAGGAQHGTWVLPPCRPGHYRLSASWFGDSNRTTNVRYVISASGATTLTIAPINQQATPTDFVHNGGSFRHLTDDFLHTLHGPITIEVYNDAPGYLICDAIRAEPIP